MSNASNLSNLANVLDDANAGEFLKSTGSGGVAFDTVAAGAVVYATADLLPLSGNSAGDMAYVTSSNRFYINNGSGWYSVSLVNTNPSITSVQDASSNTTPFTLATDGTATVITVTAADPEEVPLTYGYSVTSGSLNGSTVAQGTGSNSNVFTVTPHASQDATFTITFTASDGINQATSAHAFSLSFVTIVTDSKYTSLLANATSTGGNSTIEDSSTANSGSGHSITVNGDPYAGTFSPYRSGGYSGLFDSTGVVQLSFAGSSDFEFGTGNFTIEMWFKWNSSNKSDTTIFSNRISATAFGTGSFFFHLLPGDPTSGGIEFAFDCGTPRYRLHCGGNLTANDAFFNEGWHHYAAVRNGTSLKLFVDGQEVDEITLPANETNFGNSSDNIGLGTNPSLPDGLAGPDGEYRDVRIVKGVAITPPSGGPTEPLEAVSGTTLLLYNGEGYLKDKSTSNHSPIYGSTVPTITATGPFDYNEYSATDHGGSVYFDGSGDSLTFSEVDFGTGDFCIEGWFNRSDSSDSSVVSGFGNPTDNLEFIRFGKDSANTISMYFQGSWVFRGVSVGGEISAGNWFHYVVTRSGAAIKAFVNGKLITTASSSEDVNITAVGFSHANGGNFFSGYVSDLRVNTSIPTEYQTSSTTHGSSIFTLPTAPLSSSGASLHLKGTDASIIDKSQGSNLKLVGDTTGSTAQVKFAGSKSMYFEGSYDFISIPSDDSIFSKDYTIEFWMYPTQDTNFNMPFSKGVGLQFYHQSGNIAAAMSVSNSGTYFYNGNFGSITTNAWSHISLVRDSSANTYKFYINGTLGDTLSSSSNINAGSADWIIGAYSTAGHYAFEGYIQDVRITEGLTRYTANFTPPSAPLEG